MEAGGVMTSFRLDGKAALVQGARRGSGRTFAFRDPDGRILHAWPERR